MNDEVNELRIKNLEKDIEQIKKDIKPIIELQYGFNSLTVAVNKLSEQFEQFTTQSNNRNYDWLKWILCAIGGSILTYFFKK